MGNLNQPVIVAPASSPHHGRRRVRRLLRRFGFQLEVLVFAVFVLSALSAGAAMAKPWGYDLSAELMSPYCPGRTLASCPSPQAAELVQWIVLQEAAGSSEEEVVEILIERFGEEILGAPPAKGITLWAYIFPVAGFVLSGGVAFFALRRIVARGSGAVDGAGPSIQDSHEGAVFSASGEAEFSIQGEASTDDELARAVDEDLVARG
ncbi:MAG: cytochrome c-type biogenesis protein CcmH [Myxococcota bacterium]